MVIIKLLLKKNDVLFRYVFQGPGVRSYSSGYVFYGIFTLQNVQVNWITLTYLTTILHDTHQSYLVLATCFLNFYCNSFLSYRCYDKSNNIITLLHFPMVTKNNVYAHYVCGDKGFYKDKVV